MDMDIVGTEYVLYLDSTDFCSIDDGDYVVRKFVNIYYKKDLVLPNVQHLFCCIETHINGLFQVITKFGLLPRFCFIHQRLKDSILD